MAPKEISRMTSETNKIRFYIDQAILMRDYAALAVFEDRLSMCRESDDEEASPNRNAEPLRQ